VTAHDARADLARKLTEQGLAGWDSTEARRLDLAADAAPVDQFATALVDWHDLWNAPEVGEDFLIAPVVARGRGHALYAPAKAGKSLLVLYIAACAATGRAVLDQPAGDPVRVLYVDKEMTRADLRERLADMGFGPDDDLSRLAYYSLPALPALDTPQGGAELLALALHHRAELVVIDTVSRVLSGEENSNDTIQNFARYTGEGLKAAGIAALRIDHAGKDLDRGSRGGSAKNDDVDVVWQLLPRDRGRFTLKATHRRIAWVPEVVDIEQATDPLGYKLTTDSWPAGTADAARLLDRLEVPLDYGKTKARDAIKAAGEKAPRNETLLAALRFRRSDVRHLAVVEEA
jgi:hypothetical protein